MMFDLVAIEPVAVQMSFDYDSLDSYTRASLQELDAEFDAVFKRSTKEFGLIFLRAKELLPHGQYIQWLTSKGVSRKTAWRCMQAVQEMQMSHSETFALEQPVEPVEEVEEVGKFPTNEEKRQEVKTFFAEYPELAHLSDRKIARRCGVDHKTVAAIRKELFPEPELVLDPKQPQIEVAIEEPEPEPELELVESIEEEEEEVVEVSTQEKAAFAGTRLAHFSSESNEWYTPDYVISLVHRLMDGIDLDPASCELANKTVRAKKIYTIDDSGLNHNWPGRVYLNPPFGRNEIGESNQGVWSRYLIAQVKAHITEEAILFVGAVTDREWFQWLWEYPICFTDHRIHCYTATSSDHSATHGTALVYFGPQEQKFVRIFSQLGAVVRRMKHAG